MRITPTGDVGIGTTSPAAKLSVDGSAIFNESGADVDFRVEGDTEANLLFVDASADAVGIGTNTPGYKLDVNGVINGNNSIISRRASGAQPEFVLTQTGVASWAIYNPPSLTSLRFNNGNDLMTLDSSGNLGLGVTPSAWSAPAFQISRGSQFADTGSVGIQHNAYFDSGWKYIASSQGALQFQAIPGTGFLWNTAPSGTADAAITFTQAMTLTDLGELLVGTTSSEGPSKLSVVQSTTNQAGIGLRHTLGAGETFVRFLNAANSAVIGSITNNANTGVLYNVTSDQRLKENIQDAAPASALIDALQVREYDWKADGSHQRYGFIAQELVTVAPEAVHQPANHDDMMAVDYSKLVPMLVKEIQDLRKRIAILESN
jgi:hypothetical protein